MSNRLGNTLRVKLDGPEITLAHVDKAARELTEIVRELTNSISKAGRDAVRWVITRAHAASLELDVVAVPAKPAVAPSQLPEIVSTIVRGLRVVQERAERPPFFTDAALRSARDLGNLARGGIVAVQVGNGRGVATLTKRVALNVEEIIGPKLESFGTVEGMLEAVTVHQRPAFAVWEALTGQRIDCYFGDRIPLDRIFGAFGKRVAVRGLIRARKTGERLSIEARELQEFPDESELPSADDVRGALGAEEG